VRREIGKVEGYLTIWFLMVYVPSISFTLKTICFEMFCVYDERRNE